jgi:hypothetical protein
VLFCFPVAVAFSYKIKLLLCSRAFLLFRRTAVPVPESKIFYAIIVLELHPFLSTCGKMLFFDDMSELENLTATIWCDRIY